MQNKTVRFVKKLGPRTRIKYPVFSDVGILNIENRVQQLSLYLGNSDVNHKLWNIRLTERCTPYAGTAGMLLHILVFK
jgi:hypothetical protein